MLNDSSKIFFGFSLLFLFGFSGKTVAAEAYCTGNTNVIFCNDFEDGSWHGMETNPDASIITNGVAGQTSFQGTGAMLANITTTGAYNSAKVGYRFPPGHDHVYARFYVRWEGNFTSQNHWIGIHADQAGDPWSGHGNAGCHPDGYKSYGTGLDIRPQGGQPVPGTPFFYTYHLDMSCSTNCDTAAMCTNCASRGLPCTGTPQCCWGDHYEVTTPISLVRDRWYAIEFLFRANSVSNGQAVADGELSLWVDGNLVARHPGFRWRHTTSLLLNHFTFTHYNPDQAQNFSMRYDNFVLSRAPIGPIGQTPGDQTPPVAPENLRRQ